MEEIKKKKRIGTRKDKVVQTNYNYVHPAKETAKWCWRDGRVGGVLTMEMNVKVIFKIFKMCNCATVHWVTPPGKIALCAQSLHHLAYCTAPWYLHCLPCTRFYTWYRHTLPPAAFCLSFSFTHFDVKLPVLSFFRSRFGHKIQLFILGSIKILIFHF